MQRHLGRLDYGNRDMGGGIDRFWLDGDLPISPDEQIRFLQRMYHGELPVSERSISALQEILVLEESSEYRLSGKTGTAALSPTRELVWLIGLVEGLCDQWFFALNMEGEQA